MFWNFIEIIFLELFSNLIIVENALDLWNIL